MYPTRFSHSYHHIMVLTNLNIVIFILFCIIIRIIINKIIPTNKEIENVENNPKYHINSNPNISDPIYVPSCDHICKPTRILCFIPTLWAKRKWKMDVISETYGPGCIKLMLVVDTDSNAPKSYAGYGFLSLKLSRRQNDKTCSKYLGNTIGNVNEMFTKCYTIHLHTHIDSEWTDDCCLEVVDKAMDTINNLDETLDYDQHKKILI